MLKKDPEWQLMARSKMSNVLPEKEFMNQYLEVGLCTNIGCAEKIISGVSVQPDPQQLAWVSNFKISYSQGKCEGGYGKWTSSMTRCNPPGRWVPTEWKFYSNSKTN